MAVFFEDAVVQLSNFIPKVRSTRGIFFVETELEVKVKNQERQIASLCQNYSIKVGEHPIVEQKKMDKKYWKLGEWKKLTTYDQKTWNIGRKKNGDNKKQATPTKY